MNWNLDTNPKLKAFLEATKELARWAVLFIASWLITATLAQINLVPESQTVTVWVFSYVIPVRLLVNLGLTTLGRFIDKYLFVKSKEEINNPTDLNKVVAPEATPKGLLPF